MTTYFAVNKFVGVSLDESGCCKGYWSISNQAKYGIRALFGLFRIVERSRLKLGRGSS